MKLTASFSALVLAAGLLASGVVAPATAEPTASVPVGPCDEQAADNFAAACDLPGARLAGIEPAQPRVRAGQVDRSRNMRQVARVPLAGAFTDGGDFGTDLAFKGKFAIAGNYEGFTVYDIKNPRTPRRVAQVVCPGAQNDVSIHQDLLILSVDSPRDNDTCDNRPASAGLPVGLPGQGWEGIRVFDISNPAKPRFVTSVLTACGSHTHTLAPARSGKAVFVYVSSYGPSPAQANCQPPHDSISVVKVPLAAPREARVTSQPVLFPGGGYRGSGTSSDTSGCHDITAFPRRNLAAGACMGDGILLDITDRGKPRVIDRVRDTRNFAFWHSATFSNSGRTVVFTDELGGGGAAVCNRQVGRKRGADGIYVIRNRQLKFRSYYKIPRVQSDTENCVAHNGSLVPVKGRDIMVQAWYQGGTSVWDFTNPRKPRELAHFDRGAISNSNLVVGGSWSSYWYNGFIYSSDITRGLEVFKVDTRWAKRASTVKQTELNPQSQPTFAGR